MYEGTYLQKYFFDNENFDLCLFMRDMLDLCQYGTIEECDRVEIIIQTLVLDKHMSWGLANFILRNISNYRGRLRASILWQVK